MKALAAVWEFVVGDDWRLALAAVLAIGATALAGAWWLAPLIALGALYWSLRGAGPFLLSPTGRQKDMDPPAAGDRDGRRRPAERPATGAWRRPAAK